MPGRRYFSSVSPKGQITLPAELRKKLRIRRRDQVEIELDGETVRVTPIRSSLLDHYQLAGSLREPLTMDEMTRIAAEEHAEHVAREGLE